jgi:hypothetical protein
MRTIFPKATTRATWISMALAVSGVLSVLPFAQASAGFCPATSCGVALTNSNSVGTGTFNTANFAVSLNVTTIDLNLASGDRIAKPDFPGAVGLAENLGAKLTIANLKSLAPQELSSTVSNGTSITDIRQLLQHFTARGGPGPAYSFVVARVPEPGSLMLLASGLFLALGLLRWKRVI